MIPLTNCVALAIDIDSNNPSCDISNSPLSLHIKLFPTITSIVLSSFVLDLSVFLILFSIIFSK